MKRTVTFRSYMLPMVDPETGESEDRGEFLEQFDVVVEGASLIEISRKATAQAKEMSSDSGLDVRVFEIPVH